MQPRTLKQARQARGWSLDVLAQRTGLDKSTLSRLERGKSKPMYATAEALRRALGRIRFQEESAA